MNAAPALVRLAWTEKGQGEPLVLIMGLNAPGSAWQPHVDQWSHAYRCLLVDNRGAGSSPAPPGPYTTAMMADDYAQLIDELQLGPCRVVGISMGGAIAQELALRRPDLVERLVLVATWAAGDPYTRQVLSVIDAVRQAVDEPTFSAHLQTLVWTPAWFAAHEAELVAARREPLAVGRAALSAQVAACRSHDTRDRLSQIRVPTLVTAGGADRFIPPAVSIALADGLPDARLELFADTGHVHHWEELARFNDRVEEFLT
ncbi:MAG: alpha/beta hydrolase [Propionibacteriaceae bacterium]